MNNVVIYNEFFERILSDLDLASDTIKAMLLTNRYVPRPEHRFDDVVGEVNGKGYLAGGKALENKRTAGGVFRADNLTWSDATIRDADQVLIYRRSDGLLICCLKFDESVSCKNQSFELNWDDCILDIRAFEIV